ncbi:YciI family protein [Cryptosporangium sp. NPDC051539]|uniref:YciI family protein n=1 Tax=Cryptosporangium sp. NPDC051539 TaxID=3363962 RepID=UPI003796EDC0
MKYLLLITMNPETFEALSEEEKQAVFAGHGELMEELQTTGELLGSVALAAPAASATVRVRGGAVDVTDGPYLESKEYLAGYYAVDCETMDRAIELAAKIPDAAFSAIEVRPVMNDAGLEM